MKLETRTEVWFYQEPFRIARASYDAAEIVVVTLDDGEHTAWAECCPTDRFAETLESVTTQLESVAGQLDEGLDHEKVQSLLPPGAARNALDNALWDLQAKKTGIPAWKLLRFKAPEKLVTVFSLPLLPAERLAEKARQARPYSILKLKLGGDDDDRRVAAVREAVPDKRLVVDVNEGWTNDHYRDFLPVMKRLGVEMIEQPFPAGRDGILGEMERLIPVCADESSETVETLVNIIGRYDLINIKLDKCGGLTEAKRLLDAAMAKGLKIMVGANMGTSLGVAATMLMGPHAEIADLDAPLTLGKDREGGVVYEGDQVSSPPPGFWGNH